MQTFLILDLEEDDMILGYPFLQVTNPEINWTKGNIKGTLWASTEDIAEVRKFTNPDKPKARSKQRLINLNNGSSVPQSLHNLQLGRLLNKNFPGINKY